MSATNNLSKQAVGDLVCSYQNSAVTEELYRFGTMMLAEMQERSGRLDSKSAIVLGWATGILAFLFVETNKLSGVGLYFAFASGIFTLLAVVCCFLALRTRSDWKAPSDKSWIRETALGSEDEIKRYHIRVMHDMRQLNLQITEDKSVRLRLGEIFLTAGAALLFSGIAFPIIVCVWETGHL